MTHSFTPEFIALVVTDLIGIGIFIGIVKSALNSIKTDLENIRETLNSHTEEISSLRERMAVVEEKAKNK